MPHSSYCIRTHRIRHKLGVILIHCPWLKYNLNAVSKWIFVNENLNVRQAITCTNEPGMCCQMVLLAHSKLTWLILQGNTQYNTVTVSHRAQLSQTYNIEPGAPLPCYFVPDYTGFPTNKTNHIPRSNGRAIGCHLGPIGKSITLQRDLTVHRFLCIVFYDLYALSPKGKIMYRESSASRHEQKTNFMWQRKYLHGPIMHCATGYACYKGNRIEAS